MTDLLHTTFIGMAKRAWGRFAMADSTGQVLTYGRVLVGSRLLARRIARRSAAEEMVGVLLPASVGGALANIAALMAGKIPVNLNFTAGAEAMDAAVSSCNIRTIYTSKRFLQKAAIAPTSSMVFLEDILTGIGSIEKLTTLVRTRLTPTAHLCRIYGRDQTPDALATVIFSSGSTGVPKGVMISHANILANVDAMARVFPMTPVDCFIGVLPFFHAFGFTTSLWFPLIQGCGAAFHPNPMDAKVVGELTETYRGSMLVTTPTFCQAYLRRCTREQFSSLRFVIVGGEKLREPLAAAYRDTYGINLLEGYGCTEMSPVVSVNRPDVAPDGRPQLGTKAGSVGPPLPGVSVKVVDQGSGDGPLIDRDGLLLVTGPSLMRGYLGQPERTAEVMRDGWYVTGDIARVDADGFLFVTDRLSRFSKIGGEMVPHVRVETMLTELLGESCAAVTSLPDAARGERLVLFYTRQDVAPATVWNRLSETDLPRLWLPRPDSIFQIGEIPTLGTGKVDLRRLRQLAAERTAQPS